ncbi:Uncharacterized protein C24H6.11c [Coccomyxa sp. Obi]|nr:Uncharacterized protein C24H6.11c [Coccomyxa sp. Obi]
MPGTAPGSSPTAARSALSQRLLQEHQHPPPQPYQPTESIIDIGPLGPSVPHAASLPPIHPGSHPISRSPSGRRHEVGQESQSLPMGAGRHHPPPEDFGGTSPLLGSPWPYLMRRKSIKDAPENHGVPPRPEGDEEQPEDNEDALLTPQASADPPSPGRRTSAQRSRLEERSSFVSGHGLTNVPPNNGPSNEPEPDDEPFHTDVLDVPGVEAAPLLAKPGKKKGSQMSNDILYGFINAIVGAPTMISFAAIIFQDDLYAPYLGQLAKLAFLASAVHQAVFTIFSTLPFAVGQVQDVGLIFLSAMATSIAHLCEKNGYDPHEALGTSLLTLAISTFIVGFLIVLVGHFRLATLTQYVPLSAIGGYLGYVGYFCIAAGVALACDVEIDSFTSWKHLANQDALIKLVPAVGATAALLLTLKHSRNPFVLPVVLVAIPASFHIVLLATGTSMQQAADAGWLMQPEPPRYFWEIYELYNIKDLKFDGVYFPGMLQQIPKLLALFFVVAFGSSLDVAAIQADSPEPLDYNHELKTVGLSNMVTALSGAGMTGSYIFSQTIFSMRAGVKTRIHGIIIAVSELVLFLVPISVVQYIPTFFFGSLLILFGVEITLDWLIYSYRKVTRMEFLLLWATYLAIMYTDLERGIGAGIVMATLYFAYSYAQVTVRTFSVLPTRSGVLRAVSERKILDLFSSRLAAISLSGYIFFGSSVSISDQVMSVARTLVGQEEAVLDAGPGSPQEAKARELGLDPLFSPEQRPHTAAAFAAAPRFILLDFRQVHGLDATSAQTFGTLWTMLERLGVELVITHLDNPEMERLLRAHGVIDDTHCAAFSTTEEGMQYCEEQFLAVAAQHGLCRPPSSVLTLEDILSLHGSVVPGDNHDYAAIAQKLQQYMREMHYEAGDTVIEMGEEANAFYIIEEGSVSVEANFLPDPSAPGSIDHPANVLARRDSSRWSFTFGPGTVTGAMDFIQRQPRRFRVVARQRSRALCLERAQFDHIATALPEVMVVLLTVLVRTSVVDAQHVWEYLARNNTGLR